MADLSAFPVTRRWPPEHPDRLQLYSLNTPNGVKVSIMLEELGLAVKQAVGREHDPVVLPRPHEAQAALAIVQLAQTRTDVALDAAILELVPVAAGIADDNFVAGLI